MSATAWFWAGVKRADVLSKGKGPMPRAWVQCRRHGHFTPLSEILSFQNKVGDIQAKEELSIIGPLRQEFGGGIQP